MKRIMRLIVSSVVLVFTVCANVFGDVYFYDHRDYTPYEPQPSDYYHIIAIGVAALLIISGIVVLVLRNRKKKSEYSGYEEDDFMADEYYDYEDADDIAEEYDEEDEFFEGESEE